LGAAQPYVTDDKYQMASRNQDNEGKDAKMGEGHLYVLGTGGAVAFAAPPENTLSMGMKKSYKEEMISLGAQLITDGGQAKTATAAIIDHSSDVSVLRLIGSNVSRSEEQTSELQSHSDLVCRLLLGKKKVPMCVTT